MSKFMSSEEFSEWAERHTPAEVEEKAIEQQAMLREELLESAGTTLDEYAAAPRDARVMMEEAGGQQWIAETEVADTEGQREVQSQLCDLFPTIFPSEINGNLFAERYAKRWYESNPGLPCYWEIEAMTALCSEMIEADAFPVLRSYFKS